MATVRTHAPAQRTYTVEVTPPVGNPVALRVRGMTLGATGAAQLKAFTPSALNGAIKTALEPTTQPRAHTARVMPTSAALELPSPMQTMANAAHALPEALRGTLIRGAAALLGPRFAPLVLPTLTLATTLYPRQMGDASLPVPPRARDVEPNATSTAFVPLGLQGAEHAEGFKPVNANDPKLYGPPPSEFTRPPTPPTRVLPQTHTTTLEPLEGGPRVDAPTVPGKAQHVASASDYWLLAEEVDAANEPKRVPLTFSDVVVTTQEVPNTDGAAYKKSLRLKFQAGQYGGGEISIRWPEPLVRGIVEARFEKPDQLPNRLAGEILAHALGYEKGFVPKTELQLHVTSTNKQTPIQRDAALTIAQWALAFHGQRIPTIDIEYPEMRGQFLELTSTPGFRATTRAFEAPQTTSGMPATGPGLAPPKEFVNQLPDPEALWHITDKPAGIVLAEELIGLVKSHLPKVEAPHLQFEWTYVVPAETGRTEYSLSRQKHHITAGGRDTWGAGAIVAVYDRNFNGGSIRAQRLPNSSGHYMPNGIETKKQVEAAVQADGLDGDLRFYDVNGFPPSIEPFAGLQTHREAPTTSAPRYEVRIPDARALEFDGMPNQSHQYDDLAFAVVEPTAGPQLLAHFHGVKMPEDAQRERFMSTFVGQALAAVVLYDPATRLEQPFTGIRINSKELENLRYVTEWDFVNGLTIYGIEKGLGEYSPEVPFVLQHMTESGDIEFTINPAVRTSR